MECVLCGEKAELAFCEDCMKQLETNIGMKCQVCGCIGFIPRNKANLDRIQVFLDVDVNKVPTTSAIIVPSRGCPACVSKEEIANSLGVREGLVH